MKRVLAVVAATALSVGLTTVASATAPNLSRELLSIDQMPTGWSVTNAGGAEGGLSGCLSPRIGIKPVASAKASVTFADGGNFPEVAEDLATYGSASITTIKRGFATLITTLDHCRSATLNGKRTTLQIGQMSFPQYGNQSAAFVLTFSVSGVNVAVDMVMARVGTTMVAVLEADVTTVDVSQFRGFVVKAVAKVK